MVEIRASLGVTSLLLIVACSTSTPANNATAASGTAAASTPATDPAADQAAVGKAHDVLEGAYRSSDCAAMVSMVANDGVFEPPNTPSAKGVDGIRAWCTPLYNAMKTKTLIASDKNIDLSGDIAVDHGDYDWTLTPVKGGADVHMKGRYLTIWHRQSDASWKATRLIWNSSEPAARM